MIGINAFVASVAMFGDDCRVGSLTYVRHELPDRYIASRRSPKAVQRVDISKTIGEESNVVWDHYGGPCIEQPFPPAPCCSV